LLRRHLTFPDCHLGQFQSRLAQTIPQPLVLFVSIVFTSTSSAVASSGRFPSSAVLLCVRAPSAAADGRPWRGHLPRSFGAGYFRRPVSRLLPWFAALQPLLTRPITSMVLSLLGWCSEHLAHFKRPAAMGNRSMHTVHKMHNSNRPDLDITHDAIIAFVQYAWFRKSCRILHKPSAAHPRRCPASSPVHCSPSSPSDHSLPIWGLLTLRPSLC